MPELGKKYTCYSCHTKFYDLGKPVPICPKCGADQRDAVEAPVAAPSRSRSSRPAAPVVIEEPVEEPDFAAEPETGGGVVEAEAEEEEELVVATEEREEEPEEEEEEEEF
jgi:hypothetical protein